MVLIKNNKAINRFDCGSTDPAVRTYPLLDSGKNFPKEDPQITHTTVEHLQISEFLTIHIIKCKVEIKRTVFHCGMFSHFSSTENGRQESLYKINNEKYEFIYKTDRFIR